MKTTPVQFHADYWQHVPHTHETLPCGSITVTFGWARFLIKRDVDGGVSCKLADQSARDWAMGEVERTVKV